MTPVMKRKLKAVKRMVYDLKRHIQAAEVDHRAELAKFPASEADLPSLVSQIEAEWPRLDVFSREEAERRLRLLFDTH